MEFLNGTKLLAEYTIGLEPDGRECIVVVVKGTFTIPEQGGEVFLSEEQLPFIYADTFTGEPGFSATVYESEFAPHKPKCDVLLIGSAHAPYGHPVRSVQVALRVANMTKQFEVVGERYWTGSTFGVTTSRPAPFEVMPINYDNAFGGSEPVPGNPALSNAYEHNPVGTGYYKQTDINDLLGHPVCNTQEIGRPVQSPRGKYRPMAFGPISRNFKSRIEYAGTYDDAWLEDVFPFLPKDFDNRYYQAAPQDQQISHPKGGEEIRLLNLTTTRQSPFYLPHIEVPVEFTNADYERIEQRANLDTIVIEPDDQRLQLIWRSSLPLKRNIHEMRQVVVGRMTRAWYRARELGKTYYPSLHHLVVSKREED